jgi:hypothetical protein
MVAKRSARSERVHTINQARALVLTGPDDLRTRFALHTAAGLVSGLASLWSRPGEVVGYATRIALRELGRRAEFLDGQLERLDELIAPLVAARAPGLLALHGVGRPPAMTAEQIRHARDLLTRPDNTVSSIAGLLGVSRATIYKYVPKVTTGRVAAALPPGQE